MSDYGLKFRHAGSPEPPDLAVAQTSDVSPHGWAGTGGSFHTPDTVEQVGPMYGDLATASQAEALSKREADWRALSPNTTWEY